jgi:hypothetical protein
VALAIKGSNLEALEYVSIRSGEGDWTRVPVKAHERTATLVQVTLPASAAIPGFLVVSPDDDEARGLAFLVGEQVPAPGTAAGATIMSVDPPELGPGGGTIELSGTGFAATGSVVVVREGRGVRLAVDTGTATDTTVSAELPPSYSGWADDLAVGILNVDGTGLSNILPATSTVAEPILDYTDVLSPGGAVITDVHSPIVWTTGASAGTQEIKVEGIGIGIGTEFVLRSGRRPPQHVVAETDPPAQHTTAPPSTIVGIKVPRALTDLVFNCFSLSSSQERLIAVGGGTCIGALGPVEIPLGGRRRIVPYRRAGDERVYLLPAPDPQAGSPYLSCPSTPTNPMESPAVQPATAGVKGLTRAQATTVTLQLSPPPTVPNAADPGGMLDPVPLVSQETNCFDREEGFYLRGVRLPSGTEFATATATLTDTAIPGPSNVTAVPVKVTVKAVSLGRQLPGLEDIVVDVASKTGVPPQFLKAQIIKENSSLRTTLYRYEPLAQDFVSIGWEQAPDRAKRYLTRHMFPGTGVAGDDQAPCVGLLGPSVDEAAVRKVCTHTVDTAGARVVDIGETAIVRARSGARTFSSTYQLGHPEAEFGWAPVVAGPPERTGTVQYRDPPHQSRSRGVVNPVVGDDDFQYDYVNNRVTLGKPLAAGEWVKLTYRRMKQPLPVASQAGACAQTLPGGISFFDGKGICFEATRPRLQQFSRFAQSPPTIADWFAGNVVACGNYAWVSGNSSESNLEFLSGHSPARVLDRRLEQATAQFLAAGSFGLMQFTPSRWLWKDAAILNHVFDLNDECIWRLADPNNPDRVRTSVLLAAAAHSAVARGLPRPARPSQVAWANYWAEAIMPFNGAADYGTAIVTDGLKNFGPR